MHIEAVVAVMQSLTALTGLQILNLSSKDFHDFLIFSAHFERHQTMSSKTCCFSLCIFVSELPRRVQSCTVDKEHTAVFRWLAALTALQTLDLSGMAFCILFSLPFLM